MSATADNASTNHGDTQAVLAFRGIDSARFLQGQLSIDAEKLARGASTLAGLHNPQGRVIALLGITRTSAEEFLAVLPRELAAGVVQRLRKYVLRAKVTIADVSAEYRVYGAFAEPSTGVASIAWGNRRLLLTTEADEIFDAPGADPDKWNLADILQGMPQVYTATSELFVAQMLNLDLLGAIAFDKGCYTGQEVIARAHYRGKVKRRMQRWLNAGQTILKPGDAARASDGRALSVVRAAPVDEGQAVLAVGNFGAVAAETDPVPGDTVTLRGPLDLPYSLPE